MAIAHKTIALLTAVAFAACSGSQALSSSPETKSDKPISAEAQLDCEKDPRPSCLNTYCNGNRWNSNSAFCSGMFTALLANRNLEALTSFCDLAGKSTNALQQCAQFIEKNPDAAPPNPAPGSSDYLAKKSPPGWGWVSIALGGLAAYSISHLVVAFISRFTSKPSGLEKGKIDGNINDKFKREIADFLHQKIDLIQGDGKSVAQLKNNAEGIDRIRDGYLQGLASNNTDEVREVRAYINRLSGVAKDFFITTADYIERSPGFTPKPSVIPGVPGISDEKQAFINYKNSVIALLEEFDVPEISPKISERIKDLLNAIENGLC